MTGIIQDVRYALRQLRKSPGFTTVAVLTLALGIGANTAIFSVINAVLLRPLPYFQPERIVTLSSLWMKTGDHGLVSAPDFHDWHDQSTAFSAMAFYSADETAVVIGGNAEYADVAAVSPEFFRVFEKQPIAGRLFTAEQDKADAAGSVLISDSYWETHFGGSSGALRQSLRIFGKAFNVVGVLPAGFHFPDNTNIWLPATPSSEIPERGSHNYHAVARLKDGVGLKQAQAQMTAIGTRLEKQYPPSNQGKSVAVARMHDEMVIDVRLTLYLLLGAVGVVLLIACTNTAGLLLARATSRVREIAIRAAVGASRARIMRQLIAESLVLSVLAGAVGLLLAIWCSRILVTLAPPGIPRLSETLVDGRVLGFCFCICLLVSLLFGVVPSFQASRIELSNCLKSGSTGPTVFNSSRIRGALVTVEIALSIALLASAGLLLKSFIALHDVSMGFRPEHVLVMETSFPSAGVKDSPRATRFYKELLGAVAQLPGVPAVGAARTLPAQVNSNGGYWIDHLPEKLNVTAPQAVLSVVSPGTFHAIDVPLRNGRDFNDNDTYDAPFTAIISDVLARNAFLGENPIGRTIYCGLDSLKPMTIVGVVGSVRQYGPTDKPQAEIYMPFQQHPLVSNSLNVLVRTATDPASLFEVMRRKAHDLNPEVPVKFTTLQASLSRGSIAIPRFRALLLSAFAGLAVCLAMVGVYGVMVYVVSQRRSEIGVRIALGASRGNVLRLVLRQALILLTVGIVLGLGAATSITRVFASVLFEVKPIDPFTFAAAVMLLTIAVLVASFIPARRAAKVDPMVALRYE